MTTITQKSRRLSPVCIHQGCKGRARLFGPSLGNAARMRCDKCTRQWTVVREV